jgi:histidine triad (HIT) family protein
MEKTIFEKIRDQEIPRPLLYKDTTCFAFFDIAPIKKGHTLLCSSRPYPWIDQVPTEELGHMMGIAQHIITSMKSSLGADYVKVIVVGTEVPHFHIHLIPYVFDHAAEESRSERIVEAYENTEEEQQLFAAIKSSL